MCMRMINADEATKFFGRPACITHKRVLVPIAKGEIPEVSLAVYANTNKFRMDRRGVKVIDRNPLEPVACSEHGQMEMLASTGLGLNNKASILWVRPLSNFVEGMATMDATSEEVNKETMPAMLDEVYPFTDMMGVEVAPPYKEATCWLICQPLDGTEDLCWDVLKRDALGIWRTESNLYCVVPAGYQNVFWDVLDGETMSKEDFYATNAQEFRQACQKELDAFIDAEHLRKKQLPELMAKAHGLVEQYDQISKEACFNDATLPELRFDEENEEFIYDHGEPERLTVYTLKKYESVLEHLQQDVTDYKIQSQRAAGFREILRGDLRKNITIRDYFGVLNQSARPSRFGKTVEVDLTQTEATITVLHGADKQVMHFAYSESGAAISFVEQLEELGVKAKEYDYDDDFFEKPAPKRSLQEIFLGFVSAAKA